MVFFFNYQINLISYCIISKKYKLYIIRNESVTSDILPVTPPNPSPWLNKKSKGNFCKSKISDKFRISLEILYIIKLLIYFLMYFYLNYPNFIFISIFEHHLIITYLKSKNIIFKLWQDIPPPIKRYLTGKISDDSGSFLIL